MTTLNTSSNGTGSLTGGIVRQRNTAGNYAGRDPVTVLVDAFGWTRATAEQRLKFSDDRNPAPMLTAMVTALNRGGRADVSEKLCLPLDLVRRHVCPRRPVEVAPDAQHADMLEEVEENQARSFPSLAADRRWLAKLEAAHVLQAELIASLRADIALRMAQCGE